jgi:hypothetical protein
MSLAAWGTGDRPRCTRWVYRDRKRVQCRKPATVAVQVGRFKNGRWDRPYPVCAECATLRWETTRLFTEQRAVPLPMYLQWLKGEAIEGLSCYQRRMRT